MEKDKEIQKLKEGIKNLNIALKVVLEDNKEKDKEIQKLKGFKECFVCSTYQKLIKMACCNSSMCKNCWIRIYNYNETCPYCRDNMMSLEDRLLQIHNY